MTEKRSRVRVPAPFFIVRNLHFISLLSSFSEGFFSVIIFHRRYEQMWIEFNNNPVGRAVEDCTVRALSKALKISWDEAHKELADASRQMGDMMHSTSVLSAILRKNGYTRHAISNVCPDCYTIGDFAYDHPYGTYVVGTGSHVVTIENGDIWDSWDSSQEVPQFYWKR